MNIQRVAVIGAGATGRQLAALFASAGYDTVLEDILPSNLRKAAEFLGPEKLASAEDSPAGRVHLASSVEDAVRSADLIVDCVPDELESKLEIFSMLDRMAPPRAIFVTPTRTLSIADLASCTYRADRCIAVELPLEIAAGRDITLISTSQTESQVLGAVRDLWTKAGLLVALKMDAAETSVIAGTLF